MTTRVIIPVEDEQGINSQVAQHFGRAPYFAIIDIDGSNLNVKTQPNRGEHMGGTGHPHENLLALKPNVIVAHGMGPGGLNNFKNAKVQVLKANANTVKEVITAFNENKLTQLTGGCTHAHHHVHEHGNHC